MKRTPPQYSPADIFFYYHGSIGCLVKISIFVEEVLDSLIIMLGRRRRGVADREEVEAGPGEYRRLCSANN